MALENPKPRETLIFVQLKNLKEGDVLKGHLVGDWIGGKYKKRDLLLKASEDFTIAVAPEKDAAPVPTTIEAGKKFVMPLSGTISKFWDDLDDNGGPVARMGTLYHFVYKGQDKIKKGQWAGSMAHVIEMLRDVDDKIEVSQETPVTTENMEEIPF